MTNQSIPTINQYSALISLDLPDESVGSVEKIDEDLIADLDLNVVKKITHAFHPKGTTLAYILSESHLLIHTWPELGVIHVDLVTFPLSIYLRLTKVENTHKLAS